MTQALVVMEVYWGYGGINDITVNRISANLVGIAVAMILALIPPCVYGSSPRLSKFLLEDQKRAFRDCIQFALDGSDSKKLHHLHVVAQTTFTSQFSEANSNYTDANQMKKLPLLKPNPLMKLGLDHIAVLGSSILSLIRFATYLIEHQPNGKDRFPDGSTDRRVLEAILEGLDIDDDPRKISDYNMHNKANEGIQHSRPHLLVAAPPSDRASTTFVHMCIFIMHYIMHREIKLDDIKFGMLGNQETCQGRRSTLPKKCLITFGSKKHRDSIK